MVLWSLTEESGSGACLEDRVPESLLCIMLEHFFIPLLSDCQEMRSFFPPNAPPPPIRFSHRFKVKISKENSEPLIKPSSFKLMNLRYFVLSTERWQHKFIIEFITMKWSFLWLVWWCGSEEIFTALWRILGMFGEGAVGDSDCNEWGIMGVLVGSNRKRDMKLRMAQKRRKSLWQLGLEVIHALLQQWIYLYLSILVFYGMSSLKRITYLLVEKIQR